MKSIKKITLLFTFVIFGFITVNAQNYKPTEANLATREWFQDAKFGLFVHWGVFSVLGDGEWVMNVQKINIKNYEKLPPSFNPISFDAKELVGIAKATGMKYITITSRHHDGFSMFDTKQSDWNIIQRTPYKKDPLKQLADECHAQGIKLFFYYSLLDWYHNDYYPRGNSGKTAGRPEKGDWNKYLSFMNAQLTELLTNYGEISGIWFDGWWDKKDANWELRKTYDLIHSLQPQCLVGNNHHQAVKDGEDFQMFEQDLPGANKTGFGAEAVVGQLPSETCETMNNSWGFNLLDNKYKSTEQLVHYLVKAAGNNANFLLNVGPMPSGKIQSEFLDTLQKVGTWTAKYGETIYGTRAGPISPKSWGVTTQKDGKIYIHVLNPEEENLLITEYKEKIKYIEVFGRNEKLKFKQDSYGLIIQLPKYFDQYDTVLVINKQ
jgi:alpha-L-fucosidase